MLVPRALKLHLRAHTIQEHRYRLMIITHILGNILVPFTETNKHLAYLERRSICVNVRVGELFLLLYAVRRIHNPGKVMCKPQYSAWGTVVGASGLFYYARNNSRSSKNTDFPYLCLWSVRSDEWSKMQGTNRSMHYRLPPPVSSDREVLTVLHRKPRQRGN